MSDFRKIRICYKTMEQFILGCSSLYYFDTETLRVERGTANLTVSDISFSKFEDDSMQVDLYHEDTWSTSFWLGMYFRDYDNHSISLCLDEGDVGTKQIEVSVDLNGIYINQEKLCDNHNGLHLSLDYLSKTDTGYQLGFDIDGFRVGVDVGEDIRVRGIYTSEPIDCDSSRLRALLKDCSPKRVFLRVSYLTYRDFLSERKSSNITILDPEDMIQETYKSDEIVTTLLSHGFLITKMHLLRRVSFNNKLIITNNYCDISIGDVTLESQGDCIYYGGRCLVTNSGYDEPLYLEPILVSDDNYIILVTQGSTGSKLVLFLNKTSLSLEYFLYNGEGVIASESKALYSKSKLLLGA